MRSLGARTTRLLLCAGALLVAPQAAAADGPPAPRAAVVVDVGEGVDAFVQAYLQEVAASVLREGGVRVAPPNAARAHLAALGEGAEACASDDACVRRLAASLDAPTVLFVTVAAAPRRKVRLRVQAATVRLTRVQRAPAVDAEAREVEVGTVLRDAALAALPADRPCHVEVVAAEGVSPALRAEGPDAVSRFPAFVPPGRHALTLEVPGRGRWSGTLTCAEGRRYRLTVR